MNLIYRQYDKNFEKLRLQPSQIQALEINRIDCKRGTGKNGIRKIFAIYEQELQIVLQNNEVQQGEQNTNFILNQYDLYEHQQLDAFKKEIEDYKDLLFDDAWILRVLYANHFEFPQAIEHLKKHSQWINNSDNFKWTMNTQEIIKQGAIYISGRGIGYRPIIVINADKLEKRVYPIEDIIRAIVIVLMIVKDYMLVPGKVESWYVILEAQNTSAFSIPFQNLNEIFDVLRYNFPCYLERLFILQPKTSIQITWQILEQFIPYNSRHKIEFITQDFSLIFNYIKPKQLEMRHGGRALNVYDYWPPQIDNFNEVDYQQKEQQELLKVKAQIEQLQKVSPFTSTIDQKISQLLKKEYKPKNKIYVEETHLDTTQYYVNKNKSKTVMLASPKIDKIIDEGDMDYIGQPYDQFKPTEINATFENNKDVYQPFNNSFNNQQPYQQVQQQNLQQQQQSQYFQQPQNRITQFSNKSIQNQAYQSPDQQKQIKSIKQSIGNTPFLPNLDISQNGIFQSRFIGTKQKINESQLSSSQQNPLLNSRFASIKMQNIPFKNQDVSIISNREDIPSGHQSLL